MSIDEAVQLIWEEGRQGRYMPESLRGKLNFDEGLRVQLGVLERQKESGERLAGWKIGLTSERVRKRYGTDQQPFGHIMAHRVFDSGGEVPWGEIMNCGIAPEAILFNGVAKTDAELDAAISVGGWGVMALQLDCVEEIARVDARAKALDKVARISLLLNPNIKVDTHAHTAW